MLSRLHDRKGGSKKPRATRPASEGIREARRCASDHGLELGEGRDQRPKAYGAADRDPLETATTRPYLYAEDLAKLTPWSLRSIEKMVARGTLKRGVHWFQPAG